METETFLGILRPKLSEYHFFFLSPNYLDTVLYQNTIQNLLPGTQAPHTPLNTLLHGGIGNKFKGRL